MIAFACVTTSERGFRAAAARAIERCAEPDSLLLRRHGELLGIEAYNEMLTEAARHDELEAVVLVHQDVFVHGDELLTKSRALLAASPDVAVIGTVGARGVAGPAWWEGGCHGGLTLPVLVPGGTRLAGPDGRAHEVEVVDGALLVLSAWAAREIRFDPRLSGSLVASVADVCLQVRSRGRRVVAADLGASSYVGHARAIERRPWLRAAVELKRKWASGLVPRQL